MPMPKRLKKTGLALMAVILALLLAEGFLRVIGFTYTPLSIQVIQNWSEWRYHHAFQDKHFTYDPHLIWRPRANASAFNSQGYRGKEVSAEKTPGSYRIFAVGDSNTLGWLGGDNPNWPMYLEQLLNERGDRFTVVNAGVYGYSSFQGLRRFQEALPHQPDIVLISFGANDAMRVTVSDAEFASSTIRETRLDTVLIKVRLGQLLLACSDKLFTKGKGGLVPRVSIEEYKNNLDEIIRIAKERNIRVVLLTRPFTDIQGESHDELWWKNFAADYNAATKDVGKRNGALVVDLAGYFEDKNKYYADEAHFTKEGHQLAARVIRDAISPLIDEPGAKP